MLAWWPAEKDWWYAGVVCNSNGNQVEVQYDDCNRSNLESDQVRSLSVGIGSRVYVRWKGGSNYYPGRVDDVAGAAYHIRYDDGDEEWATVSAMRFHRDDL